MNDKSNENSQFSFKDDIFSQYDDNFATEDCLKSYENNVGNHDVKMHEDSNSNKNQIEPSVSQTKIIPTFGKQKNSKKVDKKPVTKPKKFVVPVKKGSNNEEKQKNKGPIQECLDKHLKPTSLDYLSHDSDLQFMQNVDTGIMRLDSNNTTQFTQNSNNTVKTYSNVLTPLDDFQNIGSMDVFHTQNVEKVENSLEHLSNAPYIQENGQIVNKKVSLPQKTKSNILSSIISSSLYMLDDEDIIPTENLSLEVHSDQSSIKNLSQTQNQSFCSVTSLSKTYKNLDCNSFQNGGYKIPEGNEFLDLFKNDVSKKVKPVPMSTEFGDIGFNMKYSDYMKDFGIIDDLTEEENETSLKIINMYPKENSILKKKLSK